MHFCLRKGYNTGRRRKLVARYSGLRCCRRRIYTKSVEDRDLAVGRTHKFTRGRRASTRPRVSLPVVSFSSLDPSVSSVSLAAVTVWYLMYEPSFLLTSSLEESRFPAVAAAVLSLINREISSSILGSVVLSRVGTLGPVTCSSLIDWVSGGGKIVLSGCPFR